MFTSPLISDQGFLVSVRGTDYYLIFMSCLGSSAFPVRMNTELTHALSLCRGKELCYKNITACKKTRSSAHWGQVSLPSSCMCGHGDLHFSRALLQPLDTQHDHTRCFRGALMLIPCCPAQSRAELTRAQPSRQPVVVSQDTFSSLF